MKLAEIREDEAPPEVEAIYDKLRQAYGIPLVNLVWRHFATLPGVLPWAWESMAPAMPLVAAATRRVAEALEPLPRLSLGGEAASLASLYNRGNLSNLIVLTALLRGKQGDAPAPPERPPVMLPPPPPLPRLESLNAKARREVLALAALHGHGGAIIPTLYLHLAHWPALLAPLHASLSPMMATGRIAALRDKALAAASLEADGLRPCMAMPDAPAADALTAARAILVQFTERVIAEMVPIGLIIGR